MGDGYAHDLYYMEQVAKDYLPTGANVYGQAISDCESADIVQHVMSQVPDEFHGRNGTVQHRYSDLRDTIVDILKSTQTSLDESAEALDQAVQMYTEIDKNAKDQLDKLLDERDDITPEVE